MTQSSNNFVDISYQQSGRSTTTDALGMREMQAQAYAARNHKYLLIKAPPASGKSRALMFIALDKLENQGIKKVVVAVPEKSIGRSFANTDLKKYGFFADWRVLPYYNLCDVGGNESDKAGRFVEFLRDASAKVLVCAHATLRNGMKRVSDDEFDDCLLAIDEFHHTSADADSGLGDIVRRIINNSTGHIVAMTGSYFRGDGIPVLRVEDEAKFHPVTYNYYQQLNGYQHLKNLVLGYHFYHGNYLEHIGEILDTTKKTIIHIPSVNARASTGIGKYDEVAEIMKVIGTKEGKDYTTGIYTLRTSDGRLLRVADLVEDNPNDRTRTQTYLQNMKKREDVDIIIALGTAKEGFDWQWCEVCLTIGVRGSLTEVVQIIGRCTRDSEGKDTATFLNMIAMPDAAQAEVKVAVNDFLKAITASLLMEQVMAPSWKFKTVKENDNDDDNDDKLVNTIVVEGLKPLSTDKTKMIIEQQLDDLQAAVLQNDLVLRSISGSTTAENVTQNLIPKVIIERYPDLTPEEVEEVRQHFLLNTLIKGNNITDNQGNPIDTTAGMIRPKMGDDDRGMEGDRLIKIANKFINIDKLTINLIDTINPYQRAYEIISKSVDAPTLKIIQDTIAEQKFDLTLEDAINIFKGPLREYAAQHGGQVPDLKDPNPKYREMAEALQIIKNQKLRHMMGLDFDPQAK